MKEATLRNLDRAVFWSVAAISLLPLVPLALNGLIS